MSNVFEDIKVGQELVIKTYGLAGRRQYKIGTVTKVTKTQITVEIKGENAPRRFTKNWGKQIGASDSWYAPEIATEQKEGEWGMRLTTLAEVQAEFEAQQAQARKTSLIKAIKTADKSVFNRLSEKELEEIVSKLGLQEAFYAAFEA